MTELPQEITHRISEDLEIRRASTGDLPAVLGLLSQMHDDPVANQSDVSEKTFQEILASPSRAILIAIHNEAVVGTLDLFVMANLTRSGRPWAGIENLVVDTNHRHRGIGSALVEAAIDLARQLDCYKLQLVSHERRGEAHDLYRNTGFDAPVHGYRRYL